MDPIQVLEEINQVFQEILEKPDLRLRAEDTAADIDGWDSLSHMRLIGGIEKRYGIKFKLKEMMAFRSVGDICRTVQEKTSTS